MASVSLTPSGYDSTNYSYASVNSSYPLNNAVGKGSSNSTYAQWNLKTGSNAASYVFYTFDTSAIPNDVTIDSVTCSAKGYISTTTSSRVGTRQMQMYCGTSTAKGSAVTVSTSASAQNITCGTWTREELKDCRIRIYSKRGTSSTSTTYYNRFYGATLTITYTLNKASYTVTVNAGEGGVMASHGTSSVLEGDSKNFLAIPQQGYKLDNLMINGNKHPTTPVTITGVKSNGLALIHLDEDTNDSLRKATVSNNGGSLSDNKKVFGKKALYLNGNSYIKISVPSTAYSLSMWFYTDQQNASGSYPTIFSTNTTNSSGGTYMHVDDGSYSTYPVCRSNSTSGSSNTGGYASKVLTRGQWHHIGYSYDGGAHYFFLDGEKIYTVNQSSPNAIRDIYIGARCTGSSVDCHATCYVDEIFVANNCLWTSNFEPPTYPYDGEDRTGYTCSYTITSTTSVIANFIKEIINRLSIKSNGQWKDVQTIYKKINGKWVEQPNSEFKNLFSPDTHYMKGKR